MIYVMVSYRFKGIASMKVSTAWSRLASVVGVLGLSVWLVACGSASSPGAAPAQGKGPVSSPGVSTPTPTPAPAAKQTTAIPTPTSPPVAAPTSPPALGAREIKVALKNNDFPKELRVKAGEKVVFVVTNNGTVKHTFEFPDFDEMRYNEIERGETARIEWVVPNRKGKWDAGCFLTEEGFHEGMEGTLIIE